MTTPPELSDIGELREVATLEEANKLLADRWRLLRVPVGDGTFNDRYLLGQSRINQMQNASTVRDPK